MKFHVPYSELFLFEYQPAAWHLPELFQVVALGACFHDVAHLDVPITNHKM